jgi:hypothetical protein
MKARSKRLLDRAIADTVAAIEIYGKPNPSGAPLSVYLMTGTLTGLLGNRILLMSRSKTWAVAT